MNTLLATIATPGLDYAEQTLPLMRAYAERFGMDFKIYDDAKALPHAGFLKFDIIRDFGRSEYEHLVYVDADVEILPDAPMIPLSPPEGILMRGDPWVKKEMHEYVSWANQWDLKKPPQNYYNAGVFSIGKKAAKLIGSHPIIPRIHHPCFFEQHQLNVVLAMRKIRVGPLPHEFNFFIKSTKSPPGERCFLHYAQEGKLYLIGKTIVPIPKVDPLPIKAPLAVVIPYTRHDAVGVLEMLGWINVLRDVGDAALVLLADCKVDLTLQWAAEKIAKLGWPEVHAVATTHALSNEKWPNGPNWMWLHAAHYCRNRVFYILEPDCFPLRKGWLPALWQEYKACGKPYMGHIVEATQPMGAMRGYPRHMTGNGFYDVGCVNVLARFAQNGQPNANGVAHRDGLVWPWDIECARAIIPNCHHSALMYHNWGTHDVPPTFVVDGDQGVSMRSLLAGPWMVGHRNKNGDAIRILRGLLT